MAAAIFTACLAIAAAPACPAERLLFNGICLPDAWPPRIPHSHNSGGQPFPPPYLTTPPETIDVSVGRQLFVDEFLIDTARSTGIETTHHTPQYLDTNPVLRPDRIWEGSNLSEPIPWNRTLDVAAAFASPFSGGLFWDPAGDGQYKMWYRCGVPAGQCLAYSADGLTWTKPAFDVINGTNVVLPDAIDGSTVWLDLEAKDQTERYKMAAVFKKEHYNTYSILYSADGIHWRRVQERLGPAEDRSSIFLNPLREPSQWVFSIKTAPRPDASGPYGRSRSYAESANLATANWTKETYYNWTSADILDPPFICGADHFTQLYNLDAVAYESVIVGLFSIFTGKYCPAGGNSSAGVPPMNRTGEWDSVFVGYSRDGFHWTRPVIDGKHRVFLPMDDTAVACSSADPTSCDWRWNKANVQSVGGGFVVHGNMLRFYVGARTGPSQLSANATAGVAEMRRDGFASVAASISTGGASMVTPAAQLISRPLQWSAASNKTTLFVNVGGADASNMKFSFVDGNNQPLAGLAGGTIAAEGERVAVKFQTAGAISAAAALPVRLRVVFPLPTGGGGNDGGGGARLYAFWLASSQCGASNGWVAAGGPGLNATRDFNGNC